MSITHVKRVAIELVRFVLGALRLNELPDLVDSLMR